MKPILSGEPLWKAHNMVRVGYMVNIWLLVELPLDITECEIIQ